MSFIFGENLARYAEAVGEQSRGLLFYFPVMLADLFPWSLLIPVAIWWAARERFQDRVARLLVIWIATIVLFFSLSGTKEDLYILPIVTAEAALIGAMLAAAIEAASRPQPAAWSAGVTAVLLAVGGATVWVFAVVRALFAGGSGIGRRDRAFGGLVALAMVFRRRLFAAVVSLASAVIVIAGVLSSARCRTSNATSRSGPSPTSSGRAQASAPSSVHTNSRFRAWCSTSIARSWK